MKKTNVLKSVAIVLALVAVVGAFSAFLPSNDNADTNKDTSNKIDIPETEACAHLSFGEWKSGSNYHIRKCSSCTFFESEPHSYIESVCSVCGAEEPQEEVEEHECKFDYLIQMNLVKSTCQVKGSCIYPCIVEGCKETQTVALELVPHNYIGDWTKHDDLQHKQKCEWCTDYKYESHKWDNGYVSKAPTETETGEKTYACGVCGGSKVETLAALGGMTDTTAPDITGCSHDNAIFEYKNIVYHYLTCSECEISDKQEQHYSFVRNSVEYNTPLSGDASKHLQTCPCGFELEADHTYENGKCVYCDACEWHRYTSIISKYDKTSGDHINQRVCEKCGYAKTYSCNPVFTGVVASTCTTQGYSEAECDDCRGTIVNLKALAAHNFVNGICNSCGYECSHDGATTGTCSICGKILSTSSGGGTTSCFHNFVNGVCRDCSYECVHNYVWNGLTVEPTCTESGLADTICFNCNSVGTKYIEPLGHNYEHVVVQPTCTENGYDSWQCSRCDYFAIDSTLALAGHNYADGVCSICGYICEHDSYEISYVYYNDYDHLKNYTCNDCEYLFDNGSEEHAFWDLENHCASCICNSCGYERSHDFSILCEQLNSTHHTLTFVCEICDHRVEEPNEEHYYEDGSGVCSDCGYECSHDGATTGTCSICGKILSTSSGGGTTSCSHNWSDGVCKDCGHECSHNSWLESCTPLNSTYHTLILVCSTCNYRVAEPNEEHYYKDGSGVCWDCDYECSHDFSILCEQLNSTHHTLTFVCEICDYRVEEPNEEHYYDDGAVVCSDCGYTRTSSGGSSSGGDSNDEEETSCTHPYGFTAFEGDCCSWRMLCKICYEPEGDYISGDEDGDGYCDGCGHSC